MTRNKKIIVGILIVVVGWIGFRTAVVSYSFYQDGWRLGDWQKAVAEVGDYIKYRINESEKDIVKEETVNEIITPEQALAEYNQTRTVEQREEAIQNIKAMFGEDLEVTFKEVKTEYFNAGIPGAAVMTDFTQLRVLEIYEDNKGFTTEVDVKTNETLKRTQSCTKETQWVTLDQAKETARNLLVKIVDDPENYELINEDTHRKTYNAFWRKMNEGDFYSKILSKKGQFLSRAEDRFITICLLNGELMSYEYNFALTEEEITEMAEKWEATQKKDKEAIREFLGDPNVELTFVNYVTATAENKTYRIYKDENGNYYTVDDEGNVFLGREPPLSRPEPISNEKLEEIRNFNGSPEDIEKIRKFIGKPDAKIVFERNEIAEGKWMKIYKEEGERCVNYGISPSGKIYQGREPLEGCWRS
ncbi:MAG: hypothetical protein WBC21_02145 [Minisyncoccales bacterium]